jgi:hypothetical protein
MFIPSIRRRLLPIAVVVFLFSIFAVGQDNNSDLENSSEITAKVARISFISGEVQIKRSGEEDWESASLNLPLVEGDQIVTSQNARVEIQFDSQKFLRLAENSSLKITTLRDEGIAVTMSEGILSLRVFEFEKEEGFFEIDAPQTTVSIQKEGLYRIDATDSEEEVRVTITEGGEGRIYSDNLGFTLRSGRSAKVFLSSDRLGEWETADASKYSDEWDDWVAERDNDLTNLLSNAHYDQYYDRDIYGAEELSNYGSWSSSSDYGWVWRPNYSSISSYSNWSPYRYGSWRWVNPFGWVWVNDEPWGWATYHHGRWASDNRGWFWTPYEAQRPKRSYWKPALVAIFNVNNDICWYPLSYHDRFQDYNRNYRPDNRWGDRNNSRPDFNHLPENSIVGVRSDEFGRRKYNVRTISNQTVRQTWEQRPIEVAQLPKFEERRREFERDSSFRRQQPSNQIRTGAAERQAGVELDRRLQSERFRNNRQNERNRPPENSNNGTVNNNDRRNERVEKRNQDSNSERPKQTNYPTYRQSPPVAVQPTPRVENDSNRQNSERRQPRNEEQRPVSPQNNNPTENNQRPRERNKNSDENRVIVRVPENNSMENNPRVQERSNNSDENNRRSRIREKDTQNDNPNNVRQDNPQENRPVYVPRNNDENRRAAPPRSEERREEPKREQPRQEQRREEPRVEPKREEPRVERREEPRREQPQVERRREEAPRQEQPRQEQPRREEPRVERRQEQPRQDQRREEPRREQPRQEQPRQEQPRQKETPREERRTVPPRSETKQEKPIDN